MQRISAKQIELTQCEKAVETLQETLGEKQNLLSQGGKHWELRGGRCRPTLLENDALAQEGCIFLINATKI